MMNDLAHPVLCHSSRKTGTTLRRGLFALLAGAITVAITIAPPARSADGDLDPSFDTDGKVTTDFAGNSDGAAVVAIQADGKIVVAGDGHSGTSTGTDFAVIRYLDSGALDPDFNTTGKVLTDFFDNTDQALALAIQDDGKIVVVGEIDNGTDDDIGLVRYNPNGSLDTTFDTDGKVTTDFDGEYDQGWSVAIQPDNKILVAGYATISGEQELALLRYLPNGTLDDTFDTDGKVTTDFAGGNDWGLSVVLQPDNKILVAGYAHSGTSWDFALARYLPNGTLDDTFDTDGKLLTDFAGSTDEGWSVAVQPDGKILVAGRSQNSGFRFALARYNADGSLDATFDADGKVTTDIIPGFGDEAKSLALLPDGKILVAGFGGSSKDYIVTRYLQNGALDPSFGTGGIVTTDFEGFHDRACGVALQSDNKFVVAGATNTLSTSIDFSVARYLFDYRPDDLIGGSPNPASGKGNNIYNTSGAGQTLKLTSSQAKTVKGFLTLQNDAYGPDTLRLRGSRGNNFFKVTYTSGGNVSGAVTSGAFATPALDSGASHTVKITIKPDKSKLKKSIRRNGKTTTKWLKKNITLSLTGSSQIDPVKKDTAKAKVLHK